MTNTPGFIGTTLAFLIAPVLAPPLYYFSAIIFQRSGGELTLANFGMVYLLGLPVAYLVALIVGIPLLLVANRQGLQSIAWYLVGGGIAGFVVWFGISSVSEMGFDSVTLACLVFTGVMCSATFFSVIRFA